MHVINLEVLIGRQCSVCYIDTMNKRRFSKKDTMSTNGEWFVFHISTRSHCIHNLTCCVDVISNKSLFIRYYKCKNKLGLL